MNFKNIKKGWKKLWYLIWEDESWKGWLVMLIFAYIIIKLIFFPLMSLLLGSELPIAIVESCSMYHKNNLLSDFDEWWKENKQWYINHNIEKQTFEKWPYIRGQNKGDILFIVGVKPKNIEIGDVILFEAGQKNPVIHRVIDKKGENRKYIFQTKGDNNQGQLNAETKITEDKIIGKAYGRLPYLGWVKLIFVEPFRPPQGKGFCKSTF